MRAGTARRVLVIDDNKSIHEDFRRIFHQDEDDGLDMLAADFFGDDVSQESASDEDTFELGFASQGKDGADMVKEAVEAGNPFDVIFVDMRMPPGWDGFQTLRKIWEIDADCKTVVCTAYSDYAWEEIEGAAPEDAPPPVLLMKPFDPDGVLQLACASAGD